MFVLVGVVRFEWKTVDGSPREMIKFKRILAPIPEKFKKWTQLLSVWDDWLVKNGLTRLQATISFALSDPRISRVVVGVDSLNQLKEIVGAVLEKSLDFPEDLYSSDTDLINPSQWNSL